MVISLDLIYCRSDTTHFTGAKLCILDMGLPFSVLLTEIL